MIQDLNQIAEVEVSYKQNYNILERPQILSSAEAYPLFLDRWNKSNIEFVEEAKMMLLNRANRVLGIVDIARGGVSYNILDPKVIFSIALKGNASSIILCHNHPSGNLKCSKEDVTMTKKLRECAKLLDIDLNDHIIISNYGYLSMRDED